MSAEHKPHSELKTVRSALYEVAATMRGMMSDDAITARILLDPEITSCEQAIEALARLEEQTATYEKALSDIYEFEKDGTHVSEIAREALGIRPPWAP